MEHIVLMIAAVALIVQGACLMWVGLTIIRINHPHQSETPPKPRLKPSKPTKETEEQRRYKTILDNIDNYDGTGKGQRKL